MTHHQKTTPDKQTAFMALLGTCITEWAWIEEQVYEICQLILGTASEHTSIVFYRSPTLETRLALADELMSTIFPKPQNGQHPEYEAGVWSDLLEEIRNEMKIRNQLAHHPATAGVYGYMDETTGAISKVVEVKMQSSPLPHVSRRPNAKPKKELHQEDLETHLGKVRSLQIRLQAFGRDVLPHHVKKVFPQNFVA